MPHFGFTFGLAYDLRDRFVWVEAADFEDARRIFVNARHALNALRDDDPTVLDDQHLRWVTTYSEDEMIHYATIYGLTEVSIDTPVRWRYWQTGPTP